jgi:hypothetical protein
MLIIKKKYLRNRDDQALILRTTLSLALDDNLRVAARILGYIVNNCLI